MPAGPAAKGAFSEAAFRFWPGFIDRQSSTAKFLAAESCNCVPGFCVVGHFNESEASGASCITIRNDADRIDRAVGFKKGANGVFRCSKT